MNPLYRLLQTLWTLFIRGLLWLSDKRRETTSAVFAQFVKKISALLAGLIVTLAIGFSQQTPEWWPKYYSNIFYPLTITFLTGSIGFLVANFALRIVIPSLAYVPHAFAMRAMGLLEARSDKAGMIPIIERYSKAHKSGKVRVICISGFNFFRESREGLKCALSNFASSAKVHALMPTSSAENPTLFERYNSYSDEFRTATYPNIQSLLNEIEDTKTFLKATNNLVTEHNQLCMWRVVIFDSVCIVQNYFPNWDKSHSNSAPVFVFTKEPDCVASYYETFSQMFEMLTRQTERVAGTSPPNQKHFKA